MKQEPSDPPQPIRHGAGALFWLAAVCLALLGVLSIATVFYDRAAVSPALKATLDVILSPWSLTTYAATTCLVLVGGWYLWRVRGPTGSQAVAMPGPAIVGFLSLLVFTVVGAGYLLSRDIDQAFREERYAQQRGVARLKARQIDQWVQERFVDIQFLATNLHGFPAISQPDVRALTELLFAQILADHRERVAVALIGLDGKPVIQTGLTGLDVAAALEAPLAALAEQARRERASVVQSILVNEGAARRVLVTVARPITDSGPNAGVVGVILSDPTIGLLPEVTTWPSDSPTSNVLVAQRDGQNVVYLVPVPHLSEKPFLRLPISTPNLTAALAFVDGNAIREAPDFRGVPVLSATQQVTALPWAVIAKTDIAEVMKPLDDRRDRIAWIFGGVVLMSVVLVFAVWRGQRIALAAALRQYEDERAAMARNASTLMQHARDAILLIGSDGHIVEANAAAEALYGYTGSELRRLTIRDLRGDSDPTAFDNQWAAAESDDGTLFETVHRRKDGTPIDVEVSSSAVEVEGRAYHQSIMRDIGRRKVLEHQVERLLRVERALQVATGVLLRSTSEEELYQRMCGVVVDVAGYRMAFVALARNDAARTVAIVATAGHEAGFFASRVPITWAEGDTSVTGTAIRTGAIQVNQDYATNPNVAQWRDEALKRGFQSSISLPIRDGARVIGVLGLASAERHAFNAQEVGLLATLADDVSYGVAAIRARNRGDGD